MAYHRYFKKALWLRMLFAGALSICLLTPFSAMAAEGEASLSDSCTDQPAYDVFNTDRLDKILQDIITLVYDALDGVWENLYDGIAQSPNYQNAIFASLTLYLIFYAVGFLFGFVPAVFGQALLRLIKIGVIFIVISPEGLLYFRDIVVHFFADGTDYLIRLMIDIGSGNLYNIGSGPGAPFEILENIMRKVFSPKMFIIVVGSLTTGPYGPIMAMALGWSIFNVFLMILRAMEVYLLSLVIRTLLFGLAPVFFGFMLFDRTKHIFMGWINQLVNFSLQPIFLFAFLAFFTIMLEGAVDDIVDGVDLCYTKMEHVGKTPYDVQHWRFKVDEGPYEGEWTYKGCVVGTGCENKPFPITVYSILLVVILAYIGIKMSSVVVQIAADMAQSSLRLDQIPGTVNSWFSNMMSGGGHGTSSAAQAGAFRSISK